MCFRYETKGRWDPQRQEKAVRLGRILNVFGILGAHRAEKFVYQGGKIPFAPNIIL